MFKSEKWFSDSEFFLYLSDQFISCSACIFLPFLPRTNFFFLQKHVIRLVLENNVQTWRVEIVKLLQRRRHEFLPICEESFFIQLIF